MVLKPVEAESVVIRQLFPRRVPKTLNLACLGVEPAAAAYQPFEAAQSTRDKLRGQVEILPGTNPLDAFRTAECVKRVVLYIL